MAESSSIDATNPSAPGLSRFLDGWRRAKPKRCETLQRDGRLAAAGSPMPAAAPTSDGSDTAFAASLRQYRHEQLAVIAWRDLANLDALDDTLAALTALAERCIEAALQHAEQSVVERFGVLREAGGEPQRLIVIGMGKLGGGELNFSSDIDLIFAYRAGGASDGGRSLDAEDYYKRVARTLVQTLAETTADGFVYRVDTRLRPFGDAGSLVASIAAMEQYYQSHGREWERYAWIKARPVAGDIDGGHDLIGRLRPFVYRRYLDYGTFESIRDMKTLIDRQVEQREWQHNIKLGAGGIREIEFIVQAFQLIRGGQEPELQDNRLRPTLARLIAAGHLPKHVGTGLDAAYVLLRRVENRLQMADDRQTHDLPAEDAERVVLATGLGYADLAAFDTELADTRQSVQDSFEQVFASPQAEHSAPARDDHRLAALWHGQLDDEAAAAVLADYGIDDPGPICTALNTVRDQRLYRLLEDRGRRWIGRLIPLLFAAGARADDPGRAVLRTLDVLGAIIGRSTYIALLVEHPGALATLMRLCAASEWITSRLCESPALLDSLLDPRQLYRPPRGAALAAALADGLAAIDADDLERRMDALRRFTQTGILRIAAADVTDALPLMIVSDHLTELAEIVLAAALDMAWAQLAARYGLPRTTDGERAPFAVIAYGKLGGLELGYTSDLDLVFLYDGDTGHMTDGEHRQLSLQAFFTRLAQRIIHILATQTAAGRAYEIDMRLRPSGNAGLMVTQIDAFAGYQREQAWTWEHQALVRARFVAGDAGLGDRFSKLRADVLGQSRDTAALAAAVRHMRERMRGAKDESKAQRLDVKQMPGGLIDIEFMAQFAALDRGHDCPELLIFTDAIRILETLESAGISSREDIGTLTRAYREYRRRIHAQSLQRRRTMIDADELAEQRDRVAELWHEWIETPAGPRDNADS